KTTVPKVLNLKKKGLRLLIMRFFKTPALTVFPIRNGISIGGKTACLFDHPCSMQKIIGHKSQASIGKVMIETFGRTDFFAFPFGISVAGSGTYFPNPSAIGLRGYCIAQVLQRI